MDVRNNIEQIERDLATRKASVARLCRMAGINQTTWVRWKNGTPAKPTTWSRVESALCALVVDADGEAAA